MAADGEQGGIVLNVNRTSMRLGQPPLRVRLNGQSVEITRGRNYLPVPAGRHLLAVEMWSTWIFGQAEIEVDVTDGETVQVWYAAPSTNLAAGSIGLSPQRAPDRWWSTAITTLFLLAGVAALLAALLR